MIDPVTIGEVKSQAMLLHQVDEKELYDKKTQNIKKDRWA